MKNQNIRILTTLALAAAVAASATTVSAAGLLGQRYFGATLDYVMWDDDIGLDDGLGVTLNYNQPLNQSIDLTLGYSYLTSDVEGFDIDVRGHDVDFGANWYMPAANGKFFVGAALGWERVSAEGDSENSTTWSVSTGYEFPIGASASATPFVSYADYFDDEFDGTFIYGIMGEFGVSETTSLVMSVYGNDDSDFGVSAGAIFRF